MPYYELGYIKGLVQDDMIRLASRPFHFLINRYDGEDPAQIAKAVILSIRKEDFYKTDALEKKPGYYADIYRNVHCDDYPEEDWYVKVLVEDQIPILDIWSMNWEGYPH